MLLLLCCVHVQASHPPEDDRISVIDFDVENGEHFVDALNLTGSASTPLRNASWSVVNISGMTPTTLLSGPFLTSVQPVEEGLFAWTLAVDVPEVDCTCYVEIKVDDVSVASMVSRLIVYLGNDHHRPVFQEEVDASGEPMSTSYASSEHAIIVSSEVNLTFSLIQVPTSGEIISVSALVCPAPNGVCTDTPVDVALPFTTGPTGLTLTVSALALELEQGIWQFDFRATDALLRTTGSMHAVLLHDTQPPTVSLNVKSTVDEREPLHVYATLDDGYLGAAYSMTWTLEHDSGERRAPLATEFVSDDHLLLNLTEQGVYAIHLTVRDRAGYLTQSTENITVLNIRPTARISLDGLVVEDMGRLTVGAQNDWELNASQSFDNENVDYLWVINDDRSVRGTSVLASDQLSESGLHRIELIVFDNDGATHSTVVELEVLAEPTEDGQQAPLAVVLLLVLALASVFALRAKRPSAIELPKWTPSAPHSQDRTSLQDRLLDATVEEDEPRG